MHLGQARLHVEVQTVVVFGLTPPDDKQQILYCGCHVLAGIICVGGVLISIPNSEVAKIPSFAAELLQISPVS